MTGSFHDAAGEDAAEVDFSRFVSLLGVSPQHAATFQIQEKGDPASAWMLWRQEWFAPHLAPAFVAAYRNGILAHLEEVRQIDRKLDGVLSDRLRERSRLAAAPFFEGKTKMQGNREWARFAGVVAQGQSPGHIPVVFALHCALYHLPLLPALSAYAWFEFDSSRPGSEYGATEAKGESLFREILPQVAVAVQENQAELDFGGSALRAI